MTNSDRREPDPPACPLIGVVGDRQTHFTYPHAAHRCYATGAAAHIDERVQITSCLSSSHVACDRFLAWRLAASSKVLETDRSGGGQPRPRVGPTGAGTGRMVVVHVMRAGDSMARIAAKYGLTPQQIAAASGLDPDAEPGEGTRLVIPLDAPATTIEPNHRSTAGPRSR